jgi:hypothetical protein
VNLPKVRKEDLAIQESAKETLIYDLVTRKALVLNETSARIFAACGNNGTFDELKSEYGLTDKLIEQTLDGFRRNNLLDEEQHDSPSDSIDEQESSRKVFWL